MINIDKVKEYLTEPNKERCSFMKEVEYLYRYRPLKENANRELEILKNKSIYCSSFNNLNDDEEGIIIMELLSKFPSKIKSDVRKKLKDFRKKYGVTCFSTVNPEEDCAEYMWDNYAGAGKGICIQYNISELIEKKFYVLPVIYVDRINYNDFIKGEEFIAELSYVMKHRRGEDKNKTKKNWQRECEWRHIEEINEEQGNYSKKHIEPEKVFLGKDLEKGLKEKIKSITDKKIIQL